MRVDGLLLSAAFTLAVTVAKLVGTQADGHQRCRGAHLVMGLLMGCLAFMIVLPPEPHVLAALLNGVGAALDLWVWWRSRPPRNRLREKTAGVVRNLGHQLVVAPATEEGRA